MNVRGRCRTRGLLALTAGRAVRASVAVPLLLWGAWAVADVWVSNSGDDAAGTGSRVAPWATLQKAVHELNDATNGNPVVNVMPGAYAGFVNEMSDGGFPTVRVTVRSHDPDTERYGCNWEHTVLNAVSSSSVTVPNAYVTVNVDASQSTPRQKTYMLQGFTLLGTDRAGVGASNSTTWKGPGDDWPTVHNCVFTGLRWGITSVYTGWTVENSLFYGNRLAIYADNGSGTDSPKILKNVTITANTNGIYNVRNGPVEVYNSIVWGNGGFDYRAMADGHSDDYTVPIHNSDIGVFTELERDGKVIEWDLRDCVDVDPRFMGSGAVGPRDFRLRFKSVVVDGGTNALATGQAYDLYGNERIIDADQDGVCIVDMGAHEKPKPKGVVLTLR